MEKSNVEKYAEELCNENKRLKSEIDEKNCQIAEMKSHIDCLKAELKEVQTAKQELPLEPIKVAEMLICARCTYKIERAFGAVDTGTYDVYSVSDLRQIAEHLLVYCNANSNEE